MSVEASPHRQFSSGCGTLGWALFGVILAVAPRWWVATALLISFVLVSIQYVAWLQLGGRILLIWPISIRSLGRNLGLPDAVSLIAFYGSMICFVVGSLIRWHLHAHDRIPADRRLIGYIALIASCTFIASGAIRMLADDSIGGRYGRGRDVYRRTPGGVYVNASIGAKMAPVRGEIIKWSSRIMVVSTTVVVIYALTFARIG